MPKKIYKRGLKGGFLDSLGQTFSNWGSSLSQGASSVWNKTKKATGMNGSTTSSYSSPSQTQYSASAPVPAPAPVPVTPTSGYPTTSTSTTTAYGGKRRRNTRMKGGFKDNVSLTNLASHASPFAGSTAKAHNWVGGRKHKTKSKRHHKKNKTHRKRR
jgi:hypothetical protein